MKRSGTKSSPSRPLGKSSLAGSPNAPKVGGVRAMIAERVVQNPTPRPETPGAPAPAVTAANRMEDMSHISNPTIERGRIVMLKSDLTLLQAEIDARTRGDASGMVQLQAALQDMQWSPDPVLTLQRCTNLQKMLLAKINELALLSTPAQERSVDTAPKQSLVSNVIAYFKTARQQQSLSSSKQILLTREAAAVREREAAAAIMSASDLLQPDSALMPAGSGGFDSETPLTLAGTRKGVSMEQIKMNLQRLNQSLVQTKGLNPVSSGVENATDQTAGAPNPLGAGDPDLEHAHPLVPGHGGSVHTGNSSSRDQSPIPSLQGQGTAVMHPVTGMDVNALSATSIGTPQHSSTTNSSPIFGAESRKSVAFPMNGPQVTSSAIVPADDKEMKKIQFLESKLALFNRLEQALFELDPQDTLASLMKHHDGLEFMGLRHQMDHLRKGLPKKQRGMSLFNNLFGNNLASDDHSSAPTPQSGAGGKAGKEKEKTREDYEALFHQTQQQIVSNAKTVLGVQNAVIACLLDQLDKQGLEMESAESRRKDLTSSFEQRIKAQQQAFGEERRGLHTQMERDANDLQRLATTSSMSGGGGSAAPLSIGAAGDWFTSGSNFSTVGSRPASHMSSRPQSRQLPPGQATGGNSQALPGLPPRPHSSMDGQLVTTLNTTTSSNAGSRPAVGGHWSALPPRSASSLRRLPIVPTSVSENDTNSEKNLKKKLKHQQLIIKELSEKQQPKSSTL